MSIPNEHCIWKKEYLIQRTFMFGSQIHFHILCEPALNFIFLPWKKRCWWHLISGSLLQLTELSRKLVCSKETGKLRIVGNTQNRELARWRWGIKNTWLFYERTSAGRRSRGRKNTSKYQLTWPFLSPACTCAYQFWESRLHGWYLSLEQGRVSNKSLLDLAIPAALLESSKGRIYEKCFVNGKLLNKLLFLIDSISVSEKVKSEMAWKDELQSRESENLLFVFISLGKHSNPAELYLDSPKFLPQSKKSQGFFGGPSCSLHCHSKYVTSASKL